MNIDTILNTIKLGVNEIISEDDLRNLILNKKDLIIKAGFDPTTEFLHLGHIVILKKLRQFQDFGYKIRFLIGDFTASIGDPSGKNTSRKHITKSVIIKNYKTYYNQIFKILNPSLTIIHYNSTWFNLLNIHSFIELSSLSTVSQLLERSDFKSRYNLNKSISIHEFIYPLLQGYDSVFLKSDIEIGGIDQKFNFLLARDLQKKYGQKPQVLIMMPILNGMDGKNKMSKSLENCININDNYYDIFCKVMSIPDSLMEEYFIYLGFLSDIEYKSFCVKLKNPMEVKLHLSFQIVSLIYDKILAEKAKDRFINFFSKRKIPDDIELVSINVLSSKILLYNILLKISFIKSYSDFKRFLKSGAIKVNGVVVSKRLFNLKIDQSYFLQVGKKKIIKVFFKKKVIS